MAADTPIQSFVDYRFGPYRFDGRLRRLYRNGELIVLTPKAADTLVALMERAGHVVEKEELLRVVWGEVSVGDDTLAQNISTLRRVLGDDANQPRFIATVPRRGYRFVAAVRAARAPAPGETSTRRCPKRCLPRLRVRHHPRAAEDSR
jgi:DNA-binding winged helix-turn-helix (wHTH) protein